MDTKTNRDFASFLDEVLDSVSFEADDMDTEQGDAPAPTIPFDYLAVAEELHSGRIQLQADRRRGARDASDTADPYRAELEAYLEAASPLVAANPAVDDPILSIEPDAIARELGLDRMAAADYARLRRTFAFANHPDRVEPHLRERAMVRMQLANMLIDDAQERAAKV